MNQILVTEKLYITPELKKKKKAYKISFFLSIFAMIVLSCAYIYAEYDRNMLEDSSQDLLAKVMAGDIDANTEDDTTVAPRENALIVLMTSEQIVEENVNQNEALQDEDRNAITTGKVNDSKGKEYSVVGVVNIPKINCKYPIIAETTDPLLKVSVCKFWGANPNEVGNLCIVGHNYKNSKFFSKVPTLVVGDIVEITDLSGKTLKYQAYDIYTVDPSDTRCTSQLTQGKKEVTLITCTNDTKQRVIVKCTEVVE